MLGVVDRDYLYRIVDALLADDGPALLVQADAMIASGQAFATALDELASLFHRVAVVQAVPGAPGGDDAERIAGYAARMSAESVQLAYQICVQGRADLALAPDEATGFTMTLLRLRAFEPATVADARPESPSGAGSSLKAPAAAVKTPRAETAATVSSNVQIAARASLRTAAVLSNAHTPAVPPEPRLSLPETAADWRTFVAGLRLIGMAGQLAAQSELKSVHGNALSLAIPASHKHLADKAYADKLKAALEGATGRKLLLAFEIGDSGDASLAAIERRERARAKAEGEIAFRNEPFVRELVARFDAIVRPETIEPLTRDAKSLPSTRQETP